MVRASALLDGITAPVERGFSIHERMNCISSSRRRPFFWTPTIECEGIGCGVTRAGRRALASELHGYRARGEGSRWLLGMAITISQAIEKLLDSTEESGGLRLGILRRQFLKLGQQLALALGQVLRRFHRYLNIQVAGLFRAQHRHALAGQTEALAGLGSAGNLDPRLAAVDRRHLEFAAQSRGGHGNRHPAVQVGAVALEELVLRQRQENIEVARRAAAQTGLAFAGEPDAGAILDAGRDIDREHALARHPPGPSAGRAGIVDHLAAALAGRAGALEREEALGMSDLAGTAAGRAGLR